MIPVLWKIVSKYITHPDAESVELHLRCSRDGVERDVIVSGKTFYEKQVGDDVALGEW